MLYFCLDSTPISGEANCQVFDWKQKYCILYANCRKICLHDEDLDGEVCHKLSLDRQMFILTRLSMGLNLEKNHVTVGYVVSYHRGGGP